MMDQGQIVLAVGSALPFLSIAFLGMAIAKNHSSDMPIESRRSVRGSLCTYVLFWLTAIVSCNHHPQSDVMTGDIFLAMTLLLGVILLIASVYFGFRSRVAAGRRVAIASLSMIILYVAYADMSYLGYLGKPLP